MTPPPVLRVRAEPWPEPTYDSPEEAIAASHGHPREQRSERDTALIRGGTILGFDWEPACLSIALDDGRGIQIRVAGLVVDWAIGPILTARGVPPSVPGPRSLKFERTDGTFAYEYIWDARGLLEARLGRRVNGIFAGQSWLWFYADRLPILWFQSHLAIPDHSRFLHWSETE
ncbi:MAG: hypothetical protein L0216_01020 [Planctomycetales bacterium]|nr:hypothetical protein [Planctomycetales bacterium]